MPRSERRPPPRAALLLLSLLALVGLEVVARGVERLLPPTAPMVDISEAVVFEPDPADPAWVRTAPDLRLTLQRTTWVYPDQRFAREAAPGTVRVALVGGSNVFRLHASSGRLASAIQEALGDGRPVEILNGGGNAQGSRGVLHVGRELLAFHPDALVIYTGHNEHAESQVSLLVRPGPLQRVAVARLMTRAWTAVLARRHGAVSAQAVHDARAAGAGQGTVTPPPRADLPARPTYPLPEALPADVQAFRDRLDDLVAEAQAAGVRVVVATIPSNLREPQLLDDRSPALARIQAAYADGRWEEGMQLAGEALVATPRRIQASPLEDAVLRDLAARRGTALADVDAAVRAAEPHGVPGETLFTDHCHLTAEGYALWIDTVAPVVADALR